MPLVRIWQVEEILLFHPLGLLRCNDASKPAESKTKLATNSGGHVSSAPPPNEMAFRVLRLEQQLESYQRLHAEELENLRRAVQELKEQVLAFAAREESVRIADENKED